MHLMSNPGVDKHKSSIVKSIAEALALTKVYMSKGLEGGILKDFDYKFIDGTSLKQYKIKLQLDADMRITGFSEGTGKRKEYFGALEFSNDEGTITGSCSGFTDQLMKQINSNRDAYIGKIITVEFNDVIHQDDGAPIMLIDKISENAVDFIQYARQSIIF